MNDRKEKKFGQLMAAPVDGGFAMKNYWVWCGSVIRGDNGRYHMFAARWPKELPFFDGYLTHSEIVRATSDTAEGPYVFEEVVLESRGAEFWDGRITHNPTIHKAGNIYCLFYIGSTYSRTRPDTKTVWDQKNDDSRRIAEECYPNIRIGLATATSVDGPWKQRDMPILKPRPEKWDSSVVTNPAPCIAEDGSIFLYYRSNTPEGLRIGLARAESADAPFIRVVDDPVLRFSGGAFVEDPFVWHDGGGFQMLAKDMTGELTGETHAGVHAVSLDGIDWKVSDPPKAYSRKIKWDDGTTTMQGCLERPQLLFHDGRPTHLFAATADGPGGFDNATRTWNMVIPLGSN